MNKTVKFLLTSRRVWMAVFAVIQSLVLHYMHVPEDVWMTIAGLAVVMIAAFTVDDAVATSHNVDNITGKPNVEQQQRG